VEASPVIAYSLARALITQPFSRAYPKQILKIKDIKTLTDA